MERLKNHTTEKLMQHTIRHPEMVARARATIPSEALITVVVEMFQAVGDTTRVKIVYALMQQTLCVGDLALLIGISRSAISHQLRHLKDRRLVKAYRAGNVIYYSLDDHHLAALFREAEYHADHVFQELPDHPYPEI
jgi:ArsR family transcriptional regulator, lead/cadmium/zinc/bismuth-responsive transcriptional repressor